MQRSLISAKIRNDEVVLVVLRHLHPWLLALARYSVRLVEPGVARWLRRGEELGDLRRSGFGGRMGVEQVDVREPLQLLEPKRRIFLQQQTQNR